MTNIATVTATPLNPLNGNAPFVGANPAVTDFDSASVVTIEPGLELTKVVDEALVFPGTTVTYTYTAQNTGTANLRNDTGNAGWVTDDQCPGVVQVLDGTGDNVGDTNGDGLLNPAETWQFTCSTAIAALTINVATISAQPVDSGGTPIGAPLVRACGGAGASRAARHRARQDGVATGGARRRRESDRRPRRPDPTHCRLHLRRRQHRDHPARRRDPH